MVLLAQVEISKNYSHADWRDDLKRLLRRTGCDCKRTMFLFTDSQIKDEAFVEDINNMLNAGEVPNMFASDEKMQVRWSRHCTYASCQQLGSLWGSAAEKVAYAA